VDGPDSPLVGEATNLSVEHGFVTPYTSMLIDIGDQSSTNTPTQSFIGNGGPSGSRYSAGLSTPYGSELMPLAVLIGLAAVALRRRAK